MSTHKQWQAHQWFEKPWSSFFLRVRIVRALRSSKVCMKHYELINTIQQVPPVYLFVWKLLRLEPRSIIFDDPIGAATIQIGPICSSNQKGCSTQTWKGTCGWMVDEFMKEGLVELLASEPGNW